MTTHPDPTPAEAEVEVEHTRAGLASTLSQLRDNLQPAHVVEEVLGSAKISASAISNQIWDTARKNPLPALMIGAGLAMIFGLGSRAASSGTGTSLSSGGTRTPPRPGPTAMPGGPEFAAHVAKPGQVSHAPPSGSISSAVGSMKAQAADLLDSANEQLTAAGSKASAFGKRLPSRLNLGDPMSVSRDDLLNSVSRTLQEQPLILAAIGLAVGAAIGAAIPQTETENDLMGGSSHSVRDAAQGLVEEQYAQVKAAASHAVDDIKQSVADHGVTTDNLAGLVHDVGEKAKAAAYDAGKAMDPTTRS